MAESSTPHLDRPPVSPPVVDYRSTPPGVLPRQLPRWLLVGITVVMVGIMALSGTVPKPRSPGPAAGTPAPVADANQQRIEEYQRRIDEQTRRLAAEQAALQAVKEAADRPPEATTRPMRGPVTTSNPDQPFGSTRPVPEPPTRGDRSLFADNVAFSRDGPHPIAWRSENAVPAPTEPAVPPPPAPPMSAASPVPARPEPGTPQIDSVANPSPATVRSPSPAPRPAATPAPPDVRRYRIPEGSIIETVLTNRLDGTFAGPVNCLVTTAVYAPDHQHLVIPAGARALGDAHPVTTFGQVRLAVVFHRLLLPNGARVDLETFQGLDQIGATGVRDQVDRHYAQIFGASVAIGAIAGLAQTQTSIGLDATPLDAYRQGAAANLAQSSARILDRFLNVLPTVTIREGHRIKVYLSNDLELPVYPGEPVSADPHHSGDPS
jgi:type IV secretion system protein VirB10